MPHDPAPSTRATSLSLDTIVTNRRLAMLVATAVVLVALVLFAADNFTLVEVRLITLDLQMRLAWALLGAFAIGIAAGFLTCSLAHHRRR